MAATVVQSSTGRETPKNLLKVLIDSEDDLSLIPSDASPGSEAYTPDGTRKFTLDAHGAWKRTQTGGGSGGGVSAVYLDGHTLVIE